jgi:hypothetical protein
MADPNRASTEGRAERLDRGAAGEDSMTPRPGVPSDHDTTSGVLGSLEEEGIRASFVPGDAPGTLRCTVCDCESRAGTFEVVAERRMEGASDPDDMVMVVGARCPVCHISGAVVLGYGAEASEKDADIVAALAPPPQRGTPGGGRA